MAAFLGGLFGKLDKEFDARRQEAAAAKKSQASLYLDAIKSGNLTPDQFKYATEQYTKLMGLDKQGKGIMGKVGEFLLGSQSPQGSPQGGGKAPQQGGLQPPQQANQGGQGGQGGEGSPALPPPSFASTMQGAYPHQMSEEDKLKLQHTQKMEEITATAAAHGDKPIGAPQAIKFPDGTSHRIQNWRSLDGTMYQQDLGEAGGGSSGVPRVIGQLSATNAKSEASKGRVFQDEAGNDIDVAGLPEDMELRAVTLAGKTFYVPLSQNQTHFAVGGMVYAVPSLEQIRLAGGAGVELGASKVPSTRQAETMGIDPATGKPITNVLTSTTTPTTPGVTSRTPSAPSPAASPAPSPLSPPFARPAPAPKPAALPRPGGGPTAGRALPGMSAGQYNQALARTTAVREANTQIMGDPTQPDFPSLRSFESLADNAMAKARIGQAVTLALDELDQQAKAGGDLTTLAKNYAGIPQALSASKAQVFQSVMGQMTPKERQAYDATMSAFSTIVGLRSLTKAGAAQFSVKAIEREMPIIGVNTYNSGQFRDQLSHLAEVVYNGTKGVPESMWNKDELDQMRRLPSELGKSKASPKPTEYKPGLVRGGYRFKGGDPTKQESWEKVQ